MNFAKFLRAPFFTEHLWCLLLAEYRMFRHIRVSFGRGLNMSANESVHVKQLNPRKDDSETLFLETSV